MMAESPTAKPRIKWAWVDAVAGDKRLKIGERFVLTNVARKYVLNNGDTFHVRQATIADRFAVSLRTVGEAIRHGTALGYLVLDERRQRGRSHIGADQHRLLIPADAAAIKGGIPADAAENTGRTPHEYRQMLPKIPEAPNAATCGNADPYVLEDVLEDVLGKGLETAHGYADAPPPPDPSREQEHDDPEPSRYCKAHQPNGTINPCRGCGDAREANDAWKEHRRQRTETDRAHIRAAIDDCGDCDDYGRKYDGPGDCPKHPNFRRRPAA